MKFTERFKRKIIAMKSFVTLSVNIECGYILQGFANICTTDTVHVNYLNLNVFFNNFYAEICGFPKYSTWNFRLVWACKCYAIFLKYLFIFSKFYWSTSIIKWFQLGWILVNVYSFILYMYSWFSQQMGVNFKPPSFSPVYFRLLHKFGLLPLSAFF